MTPENQNHGGDAPVRSAIEIAMSGQRPMDPVNTQAESPSTPIQSALEKAMSGERPPITHEVNDPSIAPAQGSYESQGSSQTPFDLKKFKSDEKITPDISTVQRNWETNFSNTPSILVPTEKKANEEAKKPDANKKPAFDLEYGSDEDAKKRDLHQEALDKNKKANERFTGKGFSQAGTNALNAHDTISDLAKENASLEEQNRMLMERLDKIQATLDRLTGTYEQDPALAAALDPNRVRPLNPLEGVQALLLKEQEQKQIDFAKQVAEEDRLHNPLNPLYAVPVTPAPVTPEITPVTPEVDRTDPNRERNLKRAAFIAGAVVGGTTGILGGAHVAGIGVLACVGAGLLNKGLDYVGSRRINSLKSQLDSTTDPEARAKLEKRKTNWEKIRKGSVYAASFISGAGLGFAATGLLSKVFMGGHGLVWNTPEPTVIPSGGDASGSLGGDNSGIEKPLGGGEPIAPETYEGNDFIDKNGQIHTGGDSPWDSKYVAEPVGNLRGGAENSSNYVQGQWGRTPSVVDNFLRQNNVTDTSFLDSYDRDRILDETWLAINSGNTNPDMTEILKHIDTEGTAKLLTAIGK